MLKLSVEDVEVMVFDQYILSKLSYVVFPLICEHSVFVSYTCIQQPTWKGKPSLGMGQH